MGVTFSQTRPQASSSNSKTMYLDVAACTDNGRIRPSNEDSYHVSRDKKLFVLSDGMGGAAKGEVASAMAVEVVAASFEENAGVAMPPESDGQS